LVEAFADVEKVVNPESELDVVKRKIDVLEKEIEDVKKEIKTLEGKVRNDEEKDELKQKRSIYDHLLANLSELRKKKAQLEERQQQSRGAAGTAFFFLFFCFFSHVASSVSVGALSSQLERASLREHRHEGIVIVIFTIVLGCAQVFSSVSAEESLWSGSFGFDNEWSS
jgi:DNA repair exonuclease SbcCD ATPase subunit